jgi:phosphoribosylamine--glycine ligase
MGAYSPVPVATPELIKEIEEGIVIPTLAAMRERNSPYRGLLYCGLMLTDKGPRVLEFNCRFGDPETQCVLPLIKADLLEMLLSTIEEGGITGWKEKHPDFIYPGYSACVVLASQGYPGEYKTGATITGIDKEYPETVIFHAGTKFIEGRFQTAGGRVLAVTGSGKTLGAALNNAYSSIEKINFEGKYYRRDIGRKALRM